MLEDVPYWCPILKELIRDVLVDSVLKDLQSLHFSLYMLGGVCCADKGSLLQSVIHWQGSSAAYNKGLSAVLERMGRLVY